MMRRLSSSVLARVRAAPAAVRRAPRVPRACAPVLSAPRLSLVARPLSSSSSGGGGGGGGGGGAAGEAPGMDREQRRRIFWSGTLVSLVAAGGLMYVVLSTYDMSVAVLGANADEERELGEQLGFAVEPLMLGLQTVQWISGHRHVDDIEGVTAKVAEIVADRYSSVFVPRLDVAARLRAVPGSRAEADEALAEARELASEFDAHQGRLSYLLPSEEEWARPGEARHTLRRAAADAPVWVLRAYVPAEGVAEGVVSADNGPFGRAEAATAVRADDGTVTVFNPVPAGPEADAAVRALGKVTCVVAQRRSDAFLRATAEAYPDAEVFAVRFDDAGRRLLGRLDRATGELAPAKALPLGASFDELPVVGGDFSELAFLHRASRTLVVAEACQVAERDLPDFAGRLRMFASGGMPFRNRGVHVPNQYVSMITDRERYAESLAALVAATPERLVTATGAVVDAPSPELEKAFAFTSRLGPISERYYAMRFRRRAGMS